MIFGVPDCGKVCSEKHVPGFLKNWDALRKEGITQILCVAVAEPAEAAEWGRKVGIDGTKISIAADPIQAATRILGMELADPKAAGPKSLRYAAVLENGVILKMVSLMCFQKLKKHMGKCILEILELQY